MDSIDDTLSNNLRAFDRFYNLYIRHLIVPAVRQCIEGKRRIRKKLDTYTSENERLQNANDKLGKDMKKFHEMIGNFHQQVTETDLLKERNRELQEKQNDLEQDFRTREEQFKEKLQQLEKANEEKIAILMEARAKTAAAERQRMQDLLDEKSREILQLKGAIAMAQKEKEDRLTVLSMEYENKLAKIQKQKSQILQQNQQATNQDIFRKKLQHMKKTHEEEVATLKQQIRQLQDQVPSRFQTNSTPQPSHFSSAFSTKNKRK